MHGASVEDYESCGCEGGRRENSRIRGLFVMKDKVSHETVEIPKTEDSIDELLGE